VTGAAKARVAVVVLVLLVLAVPGTFAVSSQARAGARVWWLARSLRSSDSDVRHRTGHALFELGRPAIDRVLPEIIVGEFLEHAPRGGSFVFGRRTQLGADAVLRRYTIELESADVMGRTLKDRMAFENIASDPPLCETFFWLGFADTPRRLVAVVPSTNGTVGTVVLSVAIEPEVEGAVTEVMRSRLGR
jgi:hypothetical protein